MRYLVFIVAAMVLPATAMSCPLGTSPATRHTAESARAVDSECIGRLSDLEANKAAASRASNYPAIQARLYKALKQRGWHLARLDGDSVSALPVDKGV